MCVNRLIFAVKFTRIWVFAKNYAASRCVLLTFLICHRVTRVRLWELSTRFKNFDLCTSRIMRSVELVDTPAIIPPLMAYNFGVPSAASVVAKVRMYLA